MSWGEDAIEPTKNGEREDDVLVLAALEHIADQIGDAPNEAYDLTVVHGFPFYTAN